MLGLGSLDSHAETVSYSFDSGFLLTELNYTGSLGMFDSNLGTLTGAILTFDDDYRSSLHVTNSSAQTQNFRIYSELFSYRSSSISAIDSILNTPVEYQMYSTGSQSIAANDTELYGPFTASNSIFYDLSAYLTEVQAAGGGNFTINLQTLTATTTSGGGGNLDLIQVTDAASAATITYTYAPVPEPSSLLLVGGAVGFFLMRRRRRHHA